MNTERHLDINTSAIRKSDPMNIHIYVIPLYEYVYPFLLMCILKLPSGTVTVYLKTPFRHSLQCRSLVMKSTAFIGLKMPLFLLHS